MTINNTLRLNTIKDLINDDLDDYTEVEVRSEILRLVNTEGAWTGVKSKENRSELRVDFFRYLHLDSMAPE